MQSGMDEISTRWGRGAMRAAAVVGASVFTLAALPACSDSEDSNEFPNGGGGAAASGTGGMGADGGIFSDVIMGGTGGGTAANGGGTGQNQLVGTLRDFHDTHPDFEGTLGDDRGIVEDQLGADGKPVYAGGAGTLTTNGQAPFDQWFRDVDGVNQSMRYTITLEPSGGNQFTYDNQEFFPLDGELFGNEGNPHNYHFTYEIHTRFTYEGGEVFTFTGDDDLFVFINGKLAMDLGGVHAPETDTADLDALASELGITPGNSYTLDFFFAERHLTQSTFRIDTTIGNFVPVVR